MSSPASGSATGSATGPATGRPPAGPATRPPRRRRWPLAVLVALLVLVPLVGGLLGTRSTGRDLDPDNPAPAGARALAQLLEQGGVAVDRVTRAAAAADALGSGSGSGSDGATLVVTDPSLVDPQRLADLAGAASAVVLLQPDAAVLEAVAPALAVGPEGQDQQLTAAARPVAAAQRGTSTAEAGCDDPDARAAGEASTGGDPLRAAASGAVVCFDGSYGTARTSGGAPVRVFALGAAVSNDLLDDAGNAALALRAAGSQSRVVWLVASPLDAAPDAAPSALSLLPGWVAPVGVQLLLVAVAAVAWRARRFGALVVEPLPVVVRSVETARGRAALYRAARDRGAAAAALRAAARWRLAAALGLPPATAAAVVAEAAAHAAGRPAAGAVALLAGPEPVDDAALAALLRDLDALEAATAGGTRRAPTDRHHAHPQEAP